MNKLKLLSIFIVILLCFSSSSLIRAVNVSNDVPCKIEDIPNISSFTNGFFTENKGQWNSELLFIADTPFGKIGFGRNVIYYNLIKIEDEVKNLIKNDSLIKKSLFRNSILSNKLDFIDDEISNEKIRVKGCTVKLTFENSNNTIPIGDDPLPHLSNYFYGNDPKKRIIGARNFRKILYKNIYDSIDLIYFFNSNGIKYEFYLKPEANINDIKININGGDIDLIKGNKNYDLLLKTEIGSIKDSELISYSKQSKERVNIKFIKYSKNTYGFQFNPINNLNNLSKGYNRLREEIVIDPLIYSTFVGGSEDEYRYNLPIAVDSQGNVYVTGKTSSSDFPVTAGVYDTTHNGWDDVFVFKLNSSSSSLIYSTFVGGSGIEGGCSIAIDSSGNAYVTGATGSPDFPTTPGAYDRTYNDIRDLEASGDAFILKLNSSGSKLIYSTYVGGSKSECARSIFVDNRDNAYVCGFTNSSDFPTTPRAYCNFRYGGDDDIFVFKLDLQDSKFAENSITISLQVNNPYMTVNGEEREIDPGRGTKPVIIKEWGRTLLPIRAVVEALSGTVNWDSVNSKVSISLKSTNIELWVNKPMATVNGTLKWIDDSNPNVTPLIINGRTFVPIRFVAENLGCTVDWEPETMTITIKYEE